MMQEINAVRARQALEASIRAWMRRHVERSVDARTGEVDATGMVEAWDREESDGGSTLDPDHVAWDIAVKVSDAHAKK